MQKNDQKFHDSVWDFYSKNARSMPWRELDSNEAVRFYQVLVSEFMLQQTQVGRVQEKYIQWMETFPTIEDVSRATFADVLLVWQGLGYNRRALYLWHACRYVAHAGIPRSVDELVTLKGIGINTASAIWVYCFNIPLVFIETNIRTVFIFHYFMDSDSQVSDNQIIPHVARTLDASRPREWYWALMDYGTLIKKTHKLTNRSAHYTKQSSFQGSSRQLRASVLKAVLASALDYQSLAKMFQDPRLESVLQDLAHEGLIHENDGSYFVG